MGVADTGDVLTRRPVLHGENSLIDQLSSNLQHAQFNTLLLSPSCTIYTNQIKYAWSVYETDILWIHEYSLDFFSHVFRG